MIKNMTKLKIVKKHEKIKLILTDVDGVLTDGGRYYSPNGEVSKKFHTRDGMGVNILLRNGIKTVIVTKENSPITNKWAKDMNVSFVYNGIQQKEKELPKICKKFKVTPNQVAYIGDDVNDAKLLSSVGLSATPNDGILALKKTVDFICKTNGGHGSFREFTDYILKINFGNNIKWY
jgi:3-deoxy-D-manno-octulosonate 8-phosphate phosphatase (KDO 8-P phosphatase)